MCGCCRWGIRYWNHKGQYCHWLVEGLRLCGAWGFIGLLWFMIFWLVEMKKLFLFELGSSGIFCVIWVLLSSRLVRLVLFCFLIIFVVMFEVLAALNLLLRSIFDSLCLTEVLATNHLVAPRSLHKGSLRGRQIICVQKRQR